MNIRVLNTIDEAIPIIRSSLEKAAVKAGPVRIGIPGGRSASVVVQALLSCEIGIQERQVLYLVDERLEGRTNYETLLDAGLGTALTKGAKLNVPRLGLPWVEDGAQLDLLYLGVGEDGHFASLFPGSYPSLDRSDVHDVVLVEQSPKPPPRRVSITYRALRRTAAETPVYLLFFGEEKREALQRLLTQKENPATLPCMFFPSRGFSVTVITTEVLG